MDAHSDEDPASILKDRDVHPALLVATLFYALLGVMSFFDPYRGFWTGSFRRGDWILFLYTTSGLLYLYYASVRVKFGFCFRHERALSRKLHGLIGNRAIFFIPVLWPLFLAWHACVSLRESSGEGTPPDPDRSN